MYLLYEQVVVDTFVKDIAALSPPGGATHVELQANTQAVRYTMDDTTDPTASVGMLLLVTEPPKLFLIEDLVRIKFISAVGTNGVLNLHYSGGRDI
jgi:hypothetical protein